MTIHTRCPKCGCPEFTEDIGQHVNIWVCQKCGASWSEDFRPKPVPLPADRDRVRIATIQNIFQICCAALMSIPRADDKETKQRIVKIQSAAIEVANYLFDYQSLVTVLVGKRDKKFD